MVISKTTGDLSRWLKFDMTSSAVLRCLILEHKR